MTFVIIAKSQFLLPVFSWKSRESLLNFYHILASLYWCEKTKLFVSTLKVLISTLPWDISGLIWTKVSRLELDTRVLLFSKWIKIIQGISWTFFHPISHQSLKREFLFLAFTSLHLSCITSSLICQISFSICEKWNWILHSSFEANLKRNRWRFKKRIDNSCFIYLKLFVVVICHTWWRGIWGCLKFWAPEFLISF